MQKNPFIGKTIKLNSSVDVSALKENGTGIVLDIISPEQAEVGPLVLKPRNYKDGEEYLALEAYSGDWLERAWKIDSEKSNDTLYDANPGTSVSSQTFANGHKASEYKFIAIEMYWGGLSHSLDVKVIPAQAWIGTDAFNLINANGNVNLTVTNRTNTGFDIVASNSAVTAVIEGIY